MGKLFEDIADSFAYFRSLRKFRSLREKDILSRVIEKAIKSGNYAFDNSVLFDDDNSKEGDEK